MSVATAGRGFRAALAAALAVVACHGDLRFNDLTTCVEDRDCLLPFLHCDSGRCVACASDTHCAGPTPRCDMALHRCVECGVTSDCAGNAVCWTGHCEAPCAAGCPASTPICDEGACVECDEGQGCASSSRGPLCIKHMCSTCMTDAGCGGATPRCDPVSHQCVACQENADCPSATPLCDPAAGRCVALP